MEFESALTAIESAASLDDLSAAVGKWRDRSGLAHIAYHAAHVPACDRANPVLLLTYDEAWVTRYVTEDYFRLDPVVLAGRKGFLPIDWMSVDHDTAAARHFFADAESYGVGRHGVTLPIRGPFGERALFTITSNETDVYWHRWRWSHLRDFHLVSHYLHDKAMRIAGLRAAKPARPLSRREGQCLGRLARGQTPQQIAADLGLSVSAVRLYLRSARHKLDCATLERAAVKATSLGVLDDIEFN